MLYPDRVRVEVPVRVEQGLLLPDAKGERIERALFRAMTFGDNLVLERATTYEVPVAEGRKDVRHELDINEFRRLLLKRNLLEWTLPVPIEREDGWMTEGCYAQVGNVFGPLVDAFMDEFEKSIEITKDEEKRISRQAAILFSKDSKGVAEACEAVSLFCTLGNYWEKFGIDRGTLPDLPYREYLLLKIMIGKEGESARRASKSGGHAGSGTRIVGPGGRIRPSRGKRIAL